MSWRLRLIRWFARFLARRGRAYALIGPDGTYLRRYVIAGEQPLEEPPNHRPAFCLHNIRGADPDRGLTHDHPSKFSVGYVCSGAYRERRQESFIGAIRARWVRAGCFNWLPFGAYHEVVDVEPETWTLFLFGPDAGQSWGFNVPGVGHMNWKQARDEGLISLGTWKRIDENGDPLS